MATYNKTHAAEYKGEMVWKEHDCDYSLLKSSPVTNDALVIFIIDSSANYFLHLIIKSIKCILKCENFSSSKMAIQNINSVSNFKMVDN